MIKILSLVFDYIDTENPESIDDLSHWMLKNKAWKPLYLNIILEYFENRPIPEGDDEQSDELDNMRSKQDSKKAHTNAKRIMKHISEIKDDNYRDFLNWLNRSNLMNDYIMARYFFGQGYIEHMSNSEHNWSD